MKNIISYILILTWPALAGATELSPRSALFGEKQLNVSWIGHEKTYANNADEVDAGQIDTGRIDIDSDGKLEILKIFWSEGVSDKILTVKIFEDDLNGKPLFEISSSRGIQPNYKLEDLNSDGKKELIVWEGLWDGKVDGEGHSGNHFYEVSVYSWKNQTFHKTQTYKTNLKYEPFFEYSQKGLPK